MKAREPSGMLKLLLWRDAKLNRVHSKMSSEWIVWTPAKQFYSLYSQRETRVTYLEHDPYIAYPGVFAAYIGVNVPNERSVSLFKQDEKNLKQIIQKLRILQTRIIFFLQKAHSLIDLVLKFIQTEVFLLKFRIFWRLTFIFDKFKEFSEKTQDILQKLKKFCKKNTTNFSEKLKFSLTLSRR